jgi:hydrogenase maturation protease
VKKACLILGLGNPLAGDDGAGAALVHRASTDRRFPPDVEFLSGGTDLLRCEAALAGRARVILVDAVLAAAPPGEPIISEHADHPAPRQSAHRLAAMDALALLRWDLPELRRTRCTWFLIPVSGVAAEPRLSAGVEAALPVLLERLLGLVLAGGPAAR